MLKDAKRCNELLWNAGMLSCYGMLWDGKGCHGMPRDARGCYGMLFNAKGLLWSAGMPWNAREIGVAKGC